MTISYRQCEIEIFEKFWNLQESLAQTSYQFGVGCSTHFASALQFILLLIAWPRRSELHEGGRFSYFTPTFCRDRQPPLQGVAPFIEGT